MNVWELDYLSSSDEEDNAPSRVPFGSARDDTDDEYESRHGWGHGTYDSSILAARDASISKVFLTHHEPTRSDKELESIFSEALSRNQVTDEDPKFLLAKEGQEITL